jgi:signal transduction histidine kinase
VEELAVAQERNRLAREIHDGLGHYLTSINIQIKAAQAVLAQDPTRAVDALGKAQTMAEEALVDVRRSVSALRLSPVEGRPLSQAIAELVAESQAAGIPTQFEVTGDPRSLPLQIELALFRATQEGLTNVRKHAQGAQAQVQLDYASPGRVCLTVEDDGDGARPDLDTGRQVVGEGITPRFGLLGLKERAQLLGGRLTAEYLPGGGFRLAIDLPDELERSV